MIPLDFSDDIFKMCFNFSLNNLIMATSLLFVVINMVLLILMTGSVERACRKAVLPQSYLLLYQRAEDGK